MEFNLDDTLIEFSDKEHGPTQWTIRDAVEGVQIFGGIGSGKTTGSGAKIALKYLAKGFGGLVLTVKATEKDAWIKYCEETNRLDDLIIVEPGGKYDFNFLEYEASVTAKDSSVSQNIVQVLKTVIRASEEKSGGKSDDPFWEYALDMLIFNTVDLCYLAYGKITLELLYAIVESAPKIGSSLESDKNSVCVKALRTASVKLSDTINIWDAQFSRDYINSLTTNEYDAMLKTENPEARTFETVSQFFNGTYKNLSDRTRSIIEFSFTGFLFHLMKEPIYSLFGKGKCDYFPEHCFDGKIILINLPIKLYNKSGRDCQILFKYVWQRAMERRKIDSKSRPVFLFSDEAHNFIHEYDAEYQATARSSMIATVYISQNLPNYHANMGGGKSEYRVKSFLGTLATKIFHANADIETNKYASELFGDGFREVETVTVSITEKGTSQSKASSLVMDKKVRPEDFVKLKTGSSKFANVVEGYVHKQGKTFSNKESQILTTFKQSV